jgi:hypothetical protein
MKAPIPMYICETRRLILHCNVPYIFEAHPGCDECQAMASEDILTFYDEIEVPRGVIEAVIKLRHISEYLYHLGMTESKGMADFMGIAGAYGDVEELIRQF